MHIGNHKMMPGDLLEYRCKDTGIIHQWRVIGILLDADGCENLIGIEPVGRMAGTDNTWHSQTRILVPEPMVRDLVVFRAGLTDSRFSKKED